MNSYIIITLSGILVGMVVLLYGIYSYDKLKKGEVSSNNEEGIPKKEKEIQQNTELREEKVQDNKEKNSDIKVEGTDLNSKDLSDFINEEDFDDTLVLNKDDNLEKVTQNVTEIPDDNKITSDVEDLFD